MVNDGDFMNDIFLYANDNFVLHEGDFVSDVDSVVQRKFVADDGGLSLLILELMNILRCWLFHCW